VPDVNGETRHASARSRRSRLRRLRRRIGWLALLAPGLVTLIADLARRSRLLPTFQGAERTTYLSTALLSLALWASCLLAAAGRRGRARQVFAAAFVVLYCLAFGVQQGFFGFYRVYVNIDPLIFGDSIPVGLVAGLSVIEPPLFGYLLLAACVAFGSLWLVRKTVRLESKLRPVAASFAIAALTIAVTVPVSPPVPRQTAHPDVMYFHAVGVFVNDFLMRRFTTVRPQIVRVQRRRPQGVPPLNPKLPATRNVVLLLQEAQRADVTCIGYDPDCALATRASNALTPHRLPFHQVRAASSSTAVAVAVLWSGMDPTETYERIHSVPLVWEYAKAAGYDTAYWTSQNLMFGNARLFIQDLPVRCFATGTNVDPHCDVLTGADDEALVDHAIGDLPALSEPFFAVVHFSNIHRPRVVNAKHLPFQPTNLTDKGPGGLSRQNHYKNAVYLSDLAVAKFIAHLRSSEIGKRTVIFYTADHGEAYGEHRNENDHSSTVYDEEIRVPQWIDAPSGTLSAEETSGYRKNENAWISQYDQAATLFDLLGIWDDPSFAGFRSQMLGTPSARPLVERPLPLTNVSWVWEYHRPNWGMMLGPFKVLAQIEDPAYLCFDLRSDPAERKNLGTKRCSALVREADRTFGMLPKDMRRLRDRPDFGWAGRPAREAGGLQAAESNEGGKMSGSPASTQSATSTPR